LKLYNQFPIKEDQSELDEEDPQIYSINVHPMNYDSDEGCVTPEEELQAMEESG